MVQVYITPVIIFILHLKNKTFLSLLTNPEFFSFFVSTIFLIPEKEKSKLQDSFSLKDVGVRGTHPRPSWHNILHFHAVFKGSGQIIFWHATFCTGAPRLENPGSVTVGLINKIYSDCTKTSAVVKLIELFNTITF